MITFEYLTGLFEAGSYAECLVSLNNFLLFNTSNADALLLKAKCLFEIADAGEGEFSESYDAYISVLEIEPAHEKALHAAIYISVYITNQHVPQAITFCDKLLQTDNQENQLNALRYRADAYKLTEDFEKAITDFDSLIAFVSQIWTNDRSKADIELASLYWEKSYVYLHGMNEPGKALQVYKSGFDYSYPNFMPYVEIANLAFKLKDYEFGAAAAIKAFLSNDIEPVADSLQLHLKIDELLESNIINKNLIYARFIAWRVLSEVVEVRYFRCINFCP